jgi:hypothetical protein
VLETLAVNKLDPNHKFAYVGSEFGPIKLYWYKDRANNYWLYSNAPEGHESFDPLMGEPFFNSEQPVPSKYPEYFSPEGLKLNRAVPSGSNFMFNESYDPSDRFNCWYGTVKDEAGGLAYVYLDSDVRENMFLFVQQQIRLVDANLSKLRKFSASLFSGNNNHDKLIGAILILIDQGFFTIEQLLSAKVNDLSIKADYIVLLGKRLVCDTTLFDFLVNLTKGRDVAAPLFVEPTYMSAEYEVPPELLYSIFAYLNVSPKFLPYAKASLVFSQIVHKNLELGVPAETVEGVSDLELSNALFAPISVRSYVNPQLRNTLISKYNKNIAKSFGITKSDSTGVLQLDSTQYKLNEQELEYSQWLHSMPLHLVSAEEGGV